MSSGVIVQGRNRSTRYPKKMLHGFMGTPAIEWIIERCQKINTDYKVFATSIDRDDDILAEIVQKKGWNVARGSVNDVLSRFSNAVIEYNLDVVVRITGDCILTDYRLVNHALSKFYETKADYLTLTKIIDGFDVEVISANAILEADQRAKLPSEREHVTPFIRMAKHFKQIYIPYGNEDMSHIHLSLDYKEDAEVIDQILGYFDKGDFTYEDVVSLLQRDDKILEKTRHIVPNEGFKKSEDEDREYLRRLKGLSLKLTNNEEHFRKVSEIIPNCSQTFSKSYLQFSIGASPLFVKEGKGCHITDMDNNVFIDHTMGLGACILGYAFEPVIRGVEKQMRKGSVYTLPHYLEYELAELLTQTIPCAEMVRFGKNGSDVTSASVRLSRAYTERDYIACCGYHGWQDWYIATTTRDKGIPKDIKQFTLPFKYNDIKSLERLFDEFRGQISCVVMEPVSLEPPANNFLLEVRDLAHKNGALLIFDEVVTGFRFSSGGAQEFFGVTPDIACFGKAMSNGMPVSAIVGRQDLMRLFDHIFFSTTFGGETLSIASAIATINYISGYKVTEYIWMQGKQLKEETARLIKYNGLEDHLSMDGYPVRTVLNFKGEEKESLRMKTLFQQECAKRGVLFTGAHNISLPHDNKVLERTLSVYGEVMEILRYTMEYSMLDEMIEGRILEPVFRKV